MLTLGRKREPKVLLTNAEPGRCKKGMIAAGIISREAKGVFVLYRANQEGPLFKELQSMAVKGRKSGTPYVETLPKEKSKKRWYG